MTLASKVDQFNNDITVVAHGIVHGDDKTVVQTEGGPVRSFAKLIADSAQYFQDLAPFAQAFSIADRAALRTYAGVQRIVFITEAQANGSPSAVPSVFVRDDRDTTSADNDASVIVGVGGVRWKRNLGGTVSSADFMPVADGATDTAAVFEAAKDWCQRAKKKLIVEPGNYNLSRHVYFSERESIEIRAGANFVGKNLIVSGRQVSAHYNTALRPHVDFGKLGTYRRVRTTFGFHIPNWPDGSAMNNQGLTYWNGFYYVGYDVGGGYGRVQRFYENGALDATWGDVNVPSMHTAELGYRVADGRIYAASGGGTQPTYVFRFGADGKSVDQTLDYTAYGNSALLAIDNNNDLLLLHTTGAGGDAGPIDFRLIDWNDNNRVIAQFQIPNQGVPQGLDIYESVIYYYTNNKITLLDYAGNILDTWVLSMVGESEGLTVVHHYAEPCIAVGYNGTPRVYTIRPPGNTSVFKALNIIGSWNRGVANGSAGPDTTLIPSEWAGSFRKQAGVWKVSTFGSGNHTFNDVLKDPTVSATEVRFKFKRTFFQSIACVLCSAHYLSTYQARADYDENTQEIVIRLYTFAGVLVDPSTAADNILWVTVKGGVRFDNY
jgi:hypothetical protein